MSNPRFVIVTGGGSGIGRAFCLALASRGWHVAVADVDLASAEAVAREIQASGGVATGCELDVTNPRAWSELRAELAGSDGELHLLVNCAGVLVTGSLPDNSAADLQHIVEVNLMGAMLGCRAMLPWLCESQASAEPRGIINVASIFAAVAPPGFAAYNATKAGVVALTESLRGELAPLGLTATVVLPGVTPTNLFRAARYGQASHAEVCQQFVAASKITAEQVASEALRAAERGRLYAIVGRRSRWYWRLKRLAPQWLIDLVGRQAIRALQPAPAEPAAVSEVSPQAKAS